MPVTITLTTIPGTLTRERGYSCKIIELLGPSLAKETLTAISTVPDIRSAVARFGATVRLAHPNASFVVSVRLAKGNRKPSGYDVACSRNGFGQDDFLRITGLTSLEMADAVTSHRLAALAADEAAS